MTDSELAAFARRHGLSPDALDELVRVVAGMHGGAHDTVALSATQPGEDASVSESVDDGVTRIDWVTTAAPTPVALRPAKSAFALVEPRRPGDTSVELAGYELLGRIGEGGMGIVFRVRDRALNRVMAMKVLRKKRMDRAHVLARFVEEAQVTAQLQHPGIVPVHQLGQLEDGRLYFTMPEVRGDTLAQAIRDVHEAVVEGQWAQGAKGWTLRRLISAFAQVCEAVAYAHSRGVVHRDIKPANIMVGAHGEVRVLDWGIAKILGRPDLMEEETAEEPVVTRRTLSDHETKSGSIVGTLSYMAPEQARGDIEGIGPTADVYALGAVLYEVLCGQAPFRGTDIAILYARSVGARPLRTAMGEGQPPLPEGLPEICEQAMAKAQADRYPDAGALAQAVRDWLDGVRRRERAMALTRDAADAFSEAGVADARADDLTRSGVETLAGIPLWASEDEKATGWKKLDEAQRLRRSVAATALRAKMLLRTALTHDATLVEAHVGLALRYAEEHRHAEADLDEEAAARAELSLRAQLDLLPPQHVQRVALAAYLEGEGQLTLHTDTPETRVSLYRYTRRNRRLVEVFEKDLGMAPLRAVPLPMGSYVAVLEAPGRPSVRYPVLIRREAHWDATPPGGEGPRAVMLPPSDVLRGDEVFVPAGWYWSGGDPQAPDPLPRRRVWLDDFLIQRQPVTNRAYLAFLNDIVSRGGEESALAFAPRERGGTAGAQGALIYGRDEDGRFELVPDSDGDLWDLDWPVVMVSWDAVVAYARWWSAKTGLTWTPPPELAWEKAARGVDGRYFPWGDFHDPSWSCMGQSHDGRPLLAVVDQFPVDVSPYGVRGMGGNVRDWCRDVFTEAGPPLTEGRGALDSPTGAGTQLRVMRGGAWGSDVRDCRSANRSFILPGDRQPGIGFRLFRTLGAEPRDGLRRGADCTP